MMFIQLLTGKGLPPPPKLGVGRIIHGLGDPDKESHDGETLFECSECQQPKTADAYYFRQRKNGALHRLTTCKTCHIRNVARNEAKRRQRGDV